MKKIFFVLSFATLFSAQDLLAKYEMRIYPVSQSPNTIWQYGHWSSLLSPGDSLEMGAYFRAELDDEPLDTVHWYLSGVLVGTTTGNKTFKFHTPGTITATGMPHYMPGPWPAKDTLYLSFSPATLNLKLFLEGSYRGNGLMAAVADPIGHPNICDTIIVELHQAEDPYNTMFRLKGTIQTDGNGSFPVPPQAFGSSYYIVIQHRSSIETWSKNPVVMSGSNINLDFTVH